MHSEWWPWEAGMTCCHWSCGIDPSCPKAVGRRPGGMFHMPWWGGGSHRTSLPAAHSVQEQQTGLGDGVEMMNSPGVCAIGASFFFCSLNWCSVINVIGILNPCIKPLHQESKCHIFNLLTLFNNTLELYGKWNATDNPSWWLQYTQQPEVSL